MKKAFIGSLSLASKYVDEKTVNLKLNEGVYKNRDDRQHCHHTNLGYSTFILSAVDISSPRR